MLQACAARLVACMGPPGRTWCKAGIGHEVTERWTVPEKDLYVLGIIFPVCSDMQSAVPCQYLLQQTK